MQTKKTILCVDNDNDNCELLTHIFQNVGFEIISSHTPEEGIRYARTNEFAAIITDYHFDEMTGIDVSRAIRTFDQVTPIIFFTNEAQLEIKQEALKAGAQAYITRPTDFEQFEQTVIDLINNTVKE